MFSLGGCFNDRCWIGFRCKISGFNFAELMRLYNTLRTACAISYLNKSSIRKVELNYFFNGRVKAHDFQCATPFTYETLIQYRQV